jgi:hypothetical protein
MDLDSHETCRGFEKKTGSNISLKGPCKSYKCKYRRSIRRNVLGDWRFIPAKTRAACVRNTLPLLSSLSTNQEIKLQTPFVFLHCLQDNMKIDTKKCIPIQGSPDSVMIRPNKFVVHDVDAVTPFVLPGVPTPSSANPASTSTSNDDDDTLGREHKYLTTLVYTPVMASKRLDSHSRLLSLDDMGELNQKLKDIFLEDKKKEEDETEQECKEPSINKEVEKGTKDNDTKSETIIGRVFKMAFSYKTNTASRVLRSSRLVAQQC